MKPCVLRSLLCIFAIVLPSLAQDAHISTIDGKWAAKVTTPRGEEVIQFEFKNGGGEVTGTVTEAGAQPVVINNGRLDGVKLTFGTTRSRHGDGNSMVMSWTGTVVGAGESIKLVCTVANADGNNRESREFEAKRVTK